MFNLSQSDYATEDVKSGGRDSGRKAYAVAILSEVWAGAKLPPEFVRHAKRIRRQMVKEGTWASA